MPTTVTFENNQTSLLLEVKRTIQPTDALTQLGIRGYNASICLHSGASGMSEDYIEHLATLIQDGLVRFAQDHHVLIADGGTTGGVIETVGNARGTIQGSFPLVGVAVTQMVTYPGYPPTGWFSRLLDNLGREPEERYPLQDDHSHFLLVQGDEFGIESDLLVGIATANAVPHVALIINGGEIVKKEAAMHAQKGIPLVVFKGSGRFADELATNIPPDFPANAIIRIFDANSSSADDLYHLLKNLLEVS